MKKYLLVTSILLSIIITSSAQVGIGTAIPDSSAVLELKSTNKGLLPSRVALTSINIAAPINSPAPALLVYNTATAGTSPNNVTPGYYYWNGSNWVRLATGSSGIQPGTTAGQIQYWNGSQWVLLSPGVYGTQLVICNGVPAWGGCPPIIADTTAAATMITTTSATTGGNVINDGGLEVIDGICYSTSPNPTIANNVDSAYDGTGIFTLTLTGLTPQTTYYARAYTKNSAGIVYANQISFTTLSSQTGAANLVAYWKFNGNTNDSSGNGHNGTLEAGPVGLAAIPSGVPNLTVDRFGHANSAYHFAGGGNIDVPYSAALAPKAITVSLWERQDTAGRTDHPSDCYMISCARWNGWKFQTIPTRPFFTVSTDTAIYDHDAGLSIPIGTVKGAGPWIHLAVTYDGAGTESFYFNGTLVKTWTNLAGAMKPFSPPVDISIGSDLPNYAYTATDDGSGNYYIAYGGYWTGDLDDVMIYNVALTPSQVQSIYNSQSVL